MSHRGTNRDAMECSPRRGAALVVLMLLCALIPGLAVGADITFAVIGDTRPGGKGQYSAALASLAADMAGQRPLFVIGTGDYIDGADNEAQVRYQYQGFFRAIQPLQAFGRVPVALAPGNHDILGSARNQGIFLEYFNGLHYSFNSGGFHFVILDTEEPGQSGRIAGKQLAWLKQDLAAHRDSGLTFVALHQPLFPVDGHIGSSLDKHPGERDALHALFVREGVDCVFAGHEHLFRRSTRDGVDYVITGGGGAPLYAGAEQGGFHHYVLVRATAEGYRLQVRKL